MQDIVQDILEASPEQAAAEILRRRRGRDSLLGFTTYTKPDYTPDRFHAYLASELDLVVNGECDRMMIFAPPQHGKSELSTRRLPAYYLARNPTHHIISGSYGSDFAEGFGRDVRTIVTSPEYQRLFPEIAIRSDNRSVGEWQITQGGKYFAVGVGGPTTGRSAHLFLIDDPIKDRKEADSETIRNSQWAWYQDVVLTRLQKGGRVILTLTRWHYDDIAGRALELMNADKGKPWRIVRLPALCDDPDNDPLGRELGEVLAPSRFEIADLMDKKEVMSSRSWSAMYQQRPISEEGGMFKPGWFGEPVSADKLPPKRTRIRAWDLASATNGDWTVGVLMSKCHNGVFWIENVIRFRGSALDVERKIYNQAALDGKQTQILVPQDPGQAGKAQAENYVRKLAGYRIKTQRPTGPKDTRASAFAAQVEGGNVRLVRGHWNQEFLDELATFPLGAHDDQVDAAADAFNGLLGPKRAAIRDW